MVDDDINVVRNYVDQLPTEDDPRVFGLHPNASIQYEVRLSTDLVKTIIALNPSAAAGGSGTSPEEVCLEICTQFEKRLPKNISTDPDEVHADTFKPTEGTESRNALGVFVEQEVDQFNRLLRIMRVTLKDLMLALQGLQVFSPALEAM